MKRRVVNVASVPTVGDAETTGYGALAVLMLIWALTEVGRRKLS